MSQKVFVTRTLNMRKIKYIGFDMDHTLVRYHTQEFEKLAHEIMKKALVEKRGYPAKVAELPFLYDLAIRGLVIDRKKGNLLKVSRHGAIRASLHGTKPIDFMTQQKLYKSIYIDLSDTHLYTPIDTAFSISVATLYAQLVDIKDSEPVTADGKNMMPDYDTIAVDGYVVHDWATHYYPNVLEAMRHRWISPQFVTTNRIDQEPFYAEVREMAEAEAA